MRSHGDPGPSPKAMHLTSALLLLLFGGALCGCATSATRGLALDAEAPPMGQVGAPRATVGAWPSRPAWPEATESTWATAYMESTMPAPREPAYDSLPVFMPGTVRRDRSLRGEIVSTGWTPRQDGAWYPAGGGGRPAAPC